MILGVDIGGTNIKFGVVDECYNIVCKEMIPTDVQHGDKAIINDIILIALILIIISFNFLKNEV